MRGCQIPSKKYEIIVNEDTISYINYVLIGVKSWFNSTFGNFILLFASRLVLLCELVKWRAWGWDTFSHAVAAKLISRFTKQQSVLSFNDFSIEVLPQYCVSCLEVRLNKHPIPDTYYISLLLGLNKWAKTANLLHSVTFLWIFCLAAISECDPASLFLKWLRYKYLCVRLRICVLTDVCTSHHSWHHACRECNHPADCLHKMLPEGCHLDKWLI